MSDILDLIDNAIEAWEVSGDAMRWTPEPVRDDVDPVTGLAAGGIVHGGGWYMVDDRHCWIDIRTYDALRPAPAPIMLTLRQGEFRRLYLNNPVPFGLSRETDPASTERGTT